MSAAPPEKGKRLADFVRRNTAVPTQSFFRALNFELYTRCGGGAAFLRGSARQSSAALCVRGSRSAALRGSLP
jgi:hypothetical protein